MEINRASIAIAILDYMCMHVDCLVQFTAHRSLCPYMLAARHSDKRLHM